VVPYQMPLLDQEKLSGQEVTLSKKHIRFVLKPCYESLINA